MIASSFQVHHGIHTIDTGFQRPMFDAAHLIVERARAAFVDCATTHAVPTLLAALGERGLAVDDVDWLILTHVHLDHAGGAGALLRALPRARLVVHPLGAAHMMDPSRLIRSATAVYGEEEMARSYGEIVPVPAERVVEAADGHVVELAGRQLLCVETPGHARHHLCIWDARSRCWFSGDTLGLSYREFDSPRGAFVLPTTSPTQFEPEALKSSIRMLLARKPDAAYLTHYGRVENVPRLAAEMIEQIDAMVAFAREAETHGDGRHAALVAMLSDYYAIRARDHGCLLDETAVRALLEVEVEINAQGLLYRRDREEPRSA